MLSPIYKKLDEAFSESSPYIGYRYLKSQRAFRKKMRDQTWSIHFAFLNYGNHLQVTCDVAIRFNCVEDILNESQPHLSAREKKGTFTIGCLLHNWSDEAKFIWRVDRVESVPRVVSEIYRDTETAAIEFFERFGNMEETLKALQDPDLARRICTLKVAEKISAMKSALATLK